MTHPSRLGRYLLQHAIGTGGMSELYLARYTLAGDVERSCVVKRLKPELADDPATLALFLDEARINLLLDHPCVASIFDVGHGDGETWLAMELVEGHDLRWLIEAGRRSGRRCPPRVALYVIGEVLRALDHAHTARGDEGPLRLVHRDISPENVLLDRSGAVKLTDFGAASATVSQAQLRPQTTVGKLAYLAPETLARGRTSPSSDLFATGLVLYELLTCRSLQTADTARGAAAFWRGFQPTVAIARSIPLADGAAVLARALEVEPRRRWPSARHFQREIHELLLRRGGGSCADELGRYMASMEGTAEEGERVLTAPIDIPTGRGPLPFTWFGYGGGRVHGPANGADLAARLSNSADALVCPPGEGWERLGASGAGTPPRSVGILHLGAALAELAAADAPVRACLWLKRQLVVLDLAAGQIVGALRFQPEAGDPLELRFGEAGAPDERLRAVADLRSAGLIGPQHERALQRRELRALMAGPLGWDELWLMPAPGERRGIGLDLAIGMLDAAHGVGDADRLQAVVSAATRRRIAPTPAVAELSRQLRGSLWRNDRDVLDAVRRGESLSGLRRRFEADPPALDRALFALAQAGLVVID